MDLYITMTKDERGESYAGPQIKAASWTEAREIAAKLTSPLGVGSFIVVGKIVAVMSLQDLLLLNANTDGKVH